MIIVHSVLVIRTRCGPQNDETGLPGQNRLKRTARTRHAEQDNVTGKTMQPEQTCRTGHTDRTGR